MPSMQHLHPSCSTNTNRPGPAGPLQGQLADQLAQCTFTIYRWQSSAHKQPPRNASPTVPDSPVADSQQHLQQIERLEKQLFAKSDGWRGGMFEQELKKRNTFLLYAVSAHTGQVTSQQQAAGAPQQQLSGLVLGYIVVQVNSVTAHINKLAVAPEARRQGLGAALLRGALLIAIQERRALCSTLHVDASNSPALALYHKAGFSHDGMIQDYYGSGKHAKKLLADLQESPAVAAFVAMRTSGQG